MCVRAPITTGEDMNREQIIQMWKDSGDIDIVGMPYSKIEAFAALVASAEREACIVDIRWHIPRAGRHTPEYQMAMRMIERIRARGDNKLFEPCPFIECDCDGNHPLNQPAIRARGQA
jgi:hypothetical protein